MGDHQDADQAMRHRRFVGGILMVDSWSLCHSMLDAVVVDCLVERFHCCLMGVVLNEFEFEAHGRDSYIDARSGWCVRSCCRQRLLQSPKGKE